MKRFFRKKIRESCLIIICVSSSLFYFSIVITAMGNPQDVPQPIQEMFQSNLVYPQEEDEVQLTLFPSFGKNKDSEEIVTLFEIEYGITDAFQFIFEWDGLLHKNPNNGSTLSGPGNIELGGQYSWMALGDGNTHFSFGTLIELPVGAVNKKLTEGFMEIQPFVVLARDFPKFNQSQIFIELGFNWKDQLRGSPEPKAEVDSALWNVGAFFPFEAWRATLEINGKNNNIDGGSSNEIYLTPGIIYKLSRSLEIGVANSVGITNSSDDYKVIGYLMWEFELDETFN